MTPPPAPRARDNPFASDRVLSLLRYRPQGLNWDGLLARLHQLDYRAAIVGLDGTGKTTLLEDLAPHLLQLGFDPRSAFINGNVGRLERCDARRLFHALTPQTILLIDGADHLGAVAWWRVRWHARRAGGLVITSHFEGLLPTLLITDTSPALLEDLVRRLIGDEPLLAGTDLRALFRKHRGNVREALRELYDRYAGR